MCFTNPQLFPGFAKTCISALIYAAIAGAVGALISQVRRVAEMNERVDPWYQAQDGAVRILMVKRIRRADFGLYFCWKRVLGVEMLQEPYLKMLYSILAWRLCFSISRGESICCTSMKLHSLGTSFVAECCLTQIWRLCTR